VIFLCNMQAATSRGGDTAGFFWPLVQGDTDISGRNVDRLNLPENDPCPAA
jgi:hypothetical protein